MAGTYRYIPKCTKNTTKTSATFFILIWTPFPAHSMFSFMSRSDGPKDFSYEQNACRSNGFTWGWLEEVIIADAMPWLGTAIIKAFCVSNLFIRLGYYFDGLASWHIWKVILKYFRYLFFYKNLSFPFKTPYFNTRGLEWSWNYFSDTWYQYYVL